MPNMYDYDFTWTIFITPQGFEGIHDRLQRRAIESWIRLYPRPKVVLVGKEKGYDQVAQVRLHTSAYIPPILGGMLALNGRKATLVRIGIIFAT